MTDRDARCIRRAAFVLEQVQATMGLECAAVTDPDALAFRFARLLELIRERYP